MKNICEWNNCNEEGLYKAPKEKDNSKEYRLLCLEHVREFNKSWNYFSGMSDEQVINFLKSDMTWHKPTQSFSSSDNFFKILWNNTLKDENVQNLPIGDIFKIVVDDVSKLDAISKLKEQYDLAKKDIQERFDQLLSWRRLY